MSSPEQLTFEIDGTTVRGVLSMPDASGNGRRWPAVLICRGLRGFEDDATSLLRATADELVAAGLATLDFEPRSVAMIMEDFDAYTVADNIEDANTALRVLTDRDDVNAAAIGILGFDLGGITAACLARRHESINRLALLAPAGRNGVGRLGDPESPTVYAPDAMPAGYAASLADINAAGDLAFHDRPTLLLHGAADRTITSDSSLGYRRALEAAARPVEHLLVARADHLFTAEDARGACVRRLAAFFGDMAGKTA